ncbi:tetratricopeptide repeat protein [Paenibacillus humicus]|uniref:tetratricopeptide repeat protein n=1 Tax=Paenibacillus humicus TaxID=412861 RepID=UPI003D29039B
MTIWERLDIEPTHDLKTIKRAYAKLLQVYHPEEDAEGYQALREAYDRALKFVKEQQVRRDAGAEASVSASASVLGAEVSIDVSLASTGQAAAPYEDSSDHADNWGNPEVDTYDDELKISTVQQFIEKAADLYQHFPSRINPELWMQLLNSDVAWDTTYRRSLNTAMLDFVQSHRFFPSAIWRLLEGFFHWKEEMRESLEPHIVEIPASFKKYYLEQLNKDGLNYEYLIRAENINIDEFLHYREQVHRSLRESNLEEAGQALKLALQIYSDDPELLRLLVEYYFRKSQYGLAVDVLKRIFQLQPDDIARYYQRAESYYYSKQFELAVQECESILERWPELLEVRILLGQSYGARGQLSQALATYRSVLHMSDPSNTAACKIHKQALRRIFEIECLVKRNEAEKHTFDNGQNNDKEREGIIIPSVNLHNYNIENDRVQKFIEQAAALYQHFPSRINPELWMELLNLDVVSDTVYMANLSRAMLEFVQTYRYLPSAVWRLLEDCFHWKEEMRESLEPHIVQIPVSFKKYYLEQLNEDGLNYEYLLRAENINIDEFLQYREQANQSLKESKLEEAGHVLRAALQIFDDDPELLRLRVEYYFRKSQYDLAVDVLTKILKLQPDDMASYYKRAKSYYYSKQFELAVQECESILERWPEYLEVRILLGQCYDTRGQLRQALAIYRSVLHMTDPSNKAEYKIHKQASRRIFEIECLTRNKAEKYTFDSGQDNDKDPEGSHDQRSSVNYGLLIFAVLFILKFIFTR